MGLKNTLNLEIRVFTYQKLVCEEFLIFLISTIAVLVQITFQHAELRFLVIHVVKDTLLYFYITLDI